MITLTKSKKPSRAKPPLRVIGDVHGKIGGYLTLALGARASIQVGDLGFDYTRIRTVPELNPKVHRVLGGNHDNYEQWDGKFANQTAHFLGDSGMVEVWGVGDIFFTRGGRSVDRSMRFQGLDWWPEEELNYHQALKALQQYKAMRPRIVVTHECPADIIEPTFGAFEWGGQLVQPSYTAKLLQRMFDLHKPELWVFGHFHKDVHVKIDGTQFVCLNELSYLNFWPGPKQKLKLELVPGTAKIRKEGQNLSPYKSPWR